jgi:Ca-activated chloride channel family protein
MTRLVLSLTVAAATTLGAGQKTFRTEVNLVHFAVVVTDKAGAPITGLTADDFEITEAGKPQTIKFFAAGDPEDAPPLHIGFLLDTSGSMGEDIKDARTAAIKFLNTMDRAVDITLVDFDTEVRVARYSSSDYPRLVERIRSRKPDGYTALYDALGVYLNGAALQEGQKILIMYTDGGDTRSALTHSDVIDLLRASDTTVYVVGYLEHQSSSSRTAQRQQLDRFAVMTGGQALFPMSIKEVEKMYERIEREIGARYSLAYISSDTREDGAWRDVDIRLKRTDLKGVRLRTRDGYFAPLKGS